ncbi:MAG: MW1434 family type I TA system toxin [Ruminococcus sp.]
MQLASGISYKTADEQIVNCEHDAIGNMAVAFVGTSGVQMGWLASQADMLAEDWILQNKIAPAQIGSKDNENCSN